MSQSTVVTLPISEEDEALLRKLQEKAWFTFLRLYLPLFLFLLYIYFRMEPGGVFRGRYLSYGKMTHVGYALVYMIFAVVFGVIFLVFAIRDYKRLILPFQQELRMRSKYRFAFAARKYHDPIYDTCLLFYPGKENLYIKVDKKDFESIDNGEELRLEIAAVTGEVLSLRSGNRDFYRPEEFSFSDR